MFLRPVSLRPTQQSSRAFARLLLACKASRLSGISRLVLAAAVACGTCGAAAAQTVVDTVAVGSTPIASAINPVTNMIYVGGQTSGNISVINGATDAVVATITESGGVAAIAVNPVTNTVYVTNGSSYTVTVINGATNTVISTLSLGTLTANTTQAVAINTLTNKIYVSESGGTVAVIDGSTNTVTATVTAGTTPLSLAVNEVSNKIYTANYGANTVTVIDGATNGTTTVNVGSHPEQVAVNPVTNTVYVSNYSGPSLSVINGATNTVTTTISLGAGPIAVALNTVTNTIYVAGYNNTSVAVINGATNAVTTTVSTAAFPNSLAVDSLTGIVYVATGTNVTAIAPGFVTYSVTVGTSPKGVAVNPVTNRAYVCNSGSSSVSVIDGTKYTSSTVTVGAQPAKPAVNASTNTVYVSNGSDGTLSVVNGATKTVAATITVGTTPYPAAVNPVTNMIYVPNYGSTSVSVINGATNTVAATVTVGTRPTALAVNTETNRIYVLNNGSHSISVIDGATNTVSKTINLSTGAAALAINQVTNTVYVVNYGISGLLYSINGATNIVSSVSVGSEPLALAVNTVTNTIYVANYNSTSVSVVNGATNTVTATVTVGAEPDAVAVNTASNTIYVGNYADATASVINGTTNTVTATVSVGGTPNTITVNPVTGTVFIPNYQSSTLAAINGTTNTVTTVSVGNNPSGVAVNPITNIAYVSLYGASGLAVVTTGTPVTVPLTTSLSAVSDSNTVSTANLFESASPTPSFTATVTSAFTSSSTYSGVSGAVNPTPSALYYRVDSATGPWTRVAPSASANPATFSFTLPVTQAGPHTLFVYATYGAEGTTATCAAPNGTTIDIGNITALPFQIDGPIITLTGSPSSQIAGSSVTLTAALAPAAATGTVSFYDTFTSPAVLLGTGTLGGGVATYTATFASTGNHVIVAAYAGDGTYSASAGTFTETVTGSTAQTITFPQPTSPIPYTAGATATLTATSTSGLAVTYTVVSGPATVSGSTLTYTGAGTVVVQANQIGNATYAAAAPVQRTVYVQAASTTVLTTSTSATTYGAIVTLTATIGNSSATGTVDFYTGNYHLGSATLSNGVGTLTATGLPVGIDRVVAVYAGDSLNLGSTSNVVPVTITAATTAVGSASAIAQVVFSFSSTVTLNATPATAIQVLTQGAPNLDFKPASGGTCAAGATYNNGDSCTVYFTFNPTAAGTRSGAVVLFSNDATPAALATAYVSGIGTGGLVVFSTGVPTTLGSVTNPQDLAVDGFGNVYVTGGGNGASIFKYSGGASTAIVTNQAGPSGIAVDGAGNLFWGLYNAGSIMELPAGAATPVTYVSGLTHPGSAMTIDGLGNLYTVSGSSILRVDALTRAITSYALTSGGQVGGVTFDPSGNLYATDRDNNLVVKITNFSSQTTVTTSSLSSPSGIRSDAHGDLYIANYGNNTVTRYSNFTGTSPVVSGFQPEGLAIDGAGNLYIGQNTNNTYVMYNRSTTPALSFASTAVGASSAVLYTSIESDGNATAAVSAIAASANYAINAGTYPCSNGGFTAGAICYVNVSFKPTTTGTLPGTAVVSENNNNTSGTLTIPLTGTGTIGTKTITFPQPPSQAAGTSYTLTATSSNGDPVTYAITGGTGSATLSGNVVTYVTAGTVQITASSAATANASAATAVADTVTVTAAASSFTAPATNVNSTSAPQTAVMTFTTAGTPSDINVLTLGVANLDYAFVSGGTCSTAKAYTVGQTCTVQYSFAPTATGIRQGAVQLLSGSTVLATSYLGGLGQAPLLQLGGTASIAGTVSSPDLGISIDGSGNIYVGNSGTSVRKITPAGVETTIYSAGTAVQGTGVDGSGSVYILDTGTNILKKITTSGTLVQVATGVSGYEMAFGPDGTAYIADNLNNRIDTVSPAGTVATLNVTGYTFNPVGIALDVSGNIYIGDYTNRRVLKVPAGGGAATVLFSGSSLFAFGLAVDAAGNVYVGNAGASVQRYNSAGVYTGSFNANGAATVPTQITGIVMDGKGNLYAEDNGTGNQYKYNLTAYPSTAFNATPVGTTSSDSPRLVYTLNVGNAPLTISSFAAPTGFSVDSSSTNCPVTGASTVPVNGSCAFGLKYTPVSAGAGSGNFTITDNSLYSAPATQLLPVTGGVATISQPTVTGISPASGATAGGTTVTITGTNLASTTSVRFGSTSAVSFTVVNNTSITAVSPAGTGTVDIVVTNPNYTSATTASDQFTYKTAPVVTWTQTPTNFLNTPLTAATASVPGSFLYQYTSTCCGNVSSATPPTLPLGTQTVTVVFTPTDSTTYTSVTMSLSITTVNQEVFVINSGGSVTSTYDNGTSESNSVAGGGTGAAVDASGSVWSINTNVSSVSKFTDAGALSTNYSGAGIAAATALAIDGNGVVWIANGAGTVSALTNAGAAVSTMPVAAAGSISAPASITVNAAGSLWIANSGNNSVTEVIGVAAPVTTPTVQQIINANPGTKP